VIETVVVVATGVIVIEAVAAVPLPPSLDDTGPVVLVAVPTLTPRTLTENVQDAPAGIVAPDRLTLVAPAVAVTVPPHEFELKPFGVATAISEGRLSVKLIPLSEADVFGLLMVKDRLFAEPSGIVLAPKALLIPGGATTVSVDVLLVLPVPPFVELTAPEVFW
jgi:hypothetical protein